MQKDFTQHVASTLNELLSLDPGCLLTLLNARVRCNPEVTKHKHIESQSGSIGFLDILNGMLDLAGQAKITTCTDAHNNLQCFTYYQVINKEPQDASEPTATEGGLATTESDGGSTEQVQSLPEV